MNGSTGNTASGAFEKPERGQTLLSLTTARRMVPLVRRIVEEILEVRQRLTRLHPEQDRLDRRRQTLSWPERARRYQVHEEIAAADQELQKARAELEVLGVALVNADAGWVGFPTVVNGRRAYFSWKPGEETLRYWHFIDETVRRLIPASWTKVDDATLTGKR
jgi:hypothetical protein